MPYRRTPEIEDRLAATREALLHAALTALSHQGWRGVTIAGVTRKAGVATGTFYGHFQDKAALCAEVFRHAAGHELARVEAAAATQGPASARCEAALRTFAERALRGHRLAYALLAEPADPVVEAERLRHRAGYRAVFKAILEDGIASGDLMPCDPEVLAAILVGAAGEALVGPIAPARAKAARDEAVVDTLVAACLRTLPTSRR
jgi:AcrR family transcriptional regulator